MPTIGIFWHIVITKNKKIRFLRIIFVFHFFKWPHEILTYLIGRTHYITFTTCIIYVTRENIMDWLRYLRDVYYDLPLSTIGIYCYTFFNLLYLSRCSLESNRDGFYYYSFYSFLYVRIRSYPLWGFLFDFKSSNYYFSLR